MLCIVAAAVAALLYSFVSAELGFFSSSSAAGVFVLLLVVLLVADRKWHFMPTVGRTGGRDLALLLAAVLAAAALYYPPSENVLGGWDPGVYVAGGVSIARHGGISFEDPLLASMDKVERGLFTARRYTLQELYPAWRVFNEPDGSVLTPQFYHMYPVLLALTASVGGVWGCLCANPVIALLCILLIYVLCRAIVGPAMAILGPLLFVTCPAMIWLARFQNSELLGQLGFLAGFGFLFLGSAIAGSNADGNGRRRGTAACILSAMCFGVGQLARTELLMASILVLAMVVLSLGWRETTADVRRARLVWVICMFVMLVHAMLYQRHTARLYTPLGSNLYLGAMLPVASIPAAVVLWYLRGRVELLWTRLSGAVRWLAAAGFVLAVAYVSLVRVRDSSLGLERYTFLDISQLVSWPVMALALLGCVTMIVESRSTEEHAFMAAGLFVLAGVLHNRMIDPFYLWAARRFASFVLPFLFIMAAVGAGLIVRAGSNFLGGILSGRPSMKKYLPDLATSAVVCIVVALSGGKLRAVSGAADFSGMTAFIRSTAENLPAADLIVSEPDLRGVPEALHFLHGVPAVCLKNHEPDNMAALEGAIIRRLEKKQVVFMLVNDDSPYRVWTRVGLEEKRQFRWSGKFLEHRERPFPLACRERSYRLRLLEVKLTSTPENGRKS